MQEFINEKKENILTSELPSLSATYDGNKMNIEYLYNNGQKITLKDIEDLDGITNNLEKRNRIINAIKDGMTTGSLIMTIEDGKKRFHPNLQNSTVRNAFKSQKEIFKLNKIEEMNDLTIKFTVNEEFRSQIVDMTDVSNSISQLSLELHIKEIKSFVKINSGKKPIFIFDKSENQEEVEKALESAITRIGESGIIGTWQHRDGNRGGSLKTNVVNMFDSRFL